MPIIHLQFFFILLLFRLINPVVVSPTIAAVGLSFYSYGFPRVGTCIEIGVVQILLVVIFSLVSLTTELWFLTLNFCSLLHFNVRVKLHSVQETGRTNGFAILVGLELCHVAVFVTCYFFCSIFVKYRFWAIAYF